VPAGTVPSVRRVVDAVSPPHLGTAFRWLLGSSRLTNIGDGVALSAGPLLVASQTRDPPTRTLTITIVVFNVTFGAAWSVLVLWATERLGLGDVGFGLLTTTSAVGGVAGSGAYGWIERHVDLGDVMRIGLVLETLTHLALAVITAPALALLVFLVFGAHAAVWGTTASTIRHRAVPTALQGRVNAVYLMGVHGGIVAGSAVGGVIARLGGVTAPFWFAFVGSAVLVVLIWRPLSAIAHEATPGGRSAIGVQPPSP
jgi:predicted MFS family arabinose efflux permease